MNDLGQLVLRRRLRIVPDEAPDVEAFAGSSAPFERLQALEELAFRPGREFGPAAPMLFMFAPLGKIPRPSVEPLEMSIADFRIVRELPGYLVAQTPKGLRLVAATLPLWFLSAPDAAASPGEKASSVVAGPAEPEGPPAVELPTDETSVPVESPDATQTAAPSTDVGLSLAGDAVWEGLHGQDVVLGMADGTEISGRVLGQSREHFAFARLEDGLVVSVPKTQVRLIRVDFDRHMKEMPTERGTGMFATGIVLTAIGTPLFIAGVTFLAISPSFFPIYLPMLVTSVVMVPVGIPLTVGGLKRRKAWKKAHAETAHISPMFRAGPGQWTGGLTLRF